MPLALNFFTIKNDFLPNTQTEVTDSYGRSFQTLRLSLLPICNFHCIYCKTQDEKINEHIQPPQFFLKRVKKILNEISIKKIHLTGGEPTLYPYLEEIIEGLKNLGVPHISITTNGTLLDKKLKSLISAGLDSINLSLDAIDDEVLKKMGTIKSFSFYDKLIHKILDYKLKLKINSTILKDYNHHQILKLLEYCGSKEIPIRFLEYMMMGVSKEIHEKRFYSMNEILYDISQKYHIEPLIRDKHSTAKYWKTNINYVFGIIANHSEPFCYDCDRLRMDSRGNIYGCITQNKGVPIYEDDSGDEVQKKLKFSIQQKQMYFKGSSNRMHYIGG